MVRPLLLGRQDAADDYELLLSCFPNLEFAPVSREILLDAAALRARYRLRTPDGIVLATGLQSGATAAVTNDDSWRDLPSLRIVTLSELVGLISRLVLSETSGTEDAVKESGKR